MLVVYGAETVLGIPDFVSGLFLLSFDLPYTSLFRSKGAPVVTYQINLSMMKYRENRERLPIILDKLWLFVSTLPGTCLCFTKAARKSMNGFCGLGIYPCDNLFPLGSRFFIGVTSVLSSDAGEQNKALTCGPADGSAAEAARTASGLASTGSFSVRVQGASSEAKDTSGLDVGKLAP